jgi:hypothetical protein
MEVIYRMSCLRGDVENYRVIALFFRRRRFKRSLIQGEPLMGAVTAKSWTKSWTLQWVVVEWVGLFPVNVGRGTRFQAAKRTGC